MTIKQNKTALLFMALQELQSVSLPIQTAWKIYNLAQDIKSRVEFCIQEENKLIEKYGGKPNETGDVKFDSKQNASDFSQEYKALMDFDVVIDTEEICIDLNDLKDVKLKPETIGALSPVVVFKTGG